MTQAASCSRCKAELAPEAKFCPSCGARRKNDITIGQFIAVLIFFGLFVLWLRPKSEPAAGAAPAAVVAKSQSGLKYRDVEANAQRLSEVNFQDYARGVVGKRIDWTGTVVEVEKTLGGRCRIWIDMDDTGVQDVYVKTGCGAAKNFNVQDRIRVDGVIENVTTLLKSAVVTLEDDPTLYTFTN